MISRQIENREENWEAKKNNLKTRYPSLTDADLYFSNEGKGKMMKNLEVKLGMTPDELFITIATL